MLPLDQEVDKIAAEIEFAGVVSVDVGGRIEFAKAYGLAHRGRDIANTLDTRFAIASGTKGLTALTVMSLIEEGTLSLSTTARSVLGKDLPLIDDAVTVEQLLGHRSGIGDFLDEDDCHEDIAAYLLTEPPQDLADTEQYLPALDGHPQKFPPDTGFSYCNGGYVVLALIAERVTGTPFHALVHSRVCAPAGMDSTEFLRTDEPASRTALGYLKIDGSWRTNVFHLPVRGNGDGGIYSTTGDLTKFWAALFAGRIVSSVALMTAPRSESPEDNLHYGLGFWLPTGKNTVMLEGFDAGVSFRSTHTPESQLTHTVISNDSDGAWPIARRLAEILNQS
ncbi:MAG: serine hydrolase domain-containing protein [Kibdelosporangium sp.]